VDLRVADRLLEIQAGSPLERQPGCERPGTSTSALVAGSTQACS
jgi:hypothetical protein